MLFTEFKDGWPQYFEGVRLDEMSGGCWRWRTIQNLKSKGQIPGDCFTRLGSKKLLVNRDRFLDWAESQVFEGIQETGNTANPSKPECNRLASR